MHLGVDVGQAPALEVVLETGEWEAKELHPCPGIHVLAQHVHVGITIGERPLVLLLCADFGVFLGEEDVALHTAGDGDFLLALHLRVKQQRCGQQQCGEKR